MSDELAQDEEDAEDYEFDAIEERTHARHRDDDEATLVGGTRGPGSMHEDAVVFEIGDEDAHDLSDGEDDARKRRGNGRSSPVQHEDDDGEDERSGLMGGVPARKKRDD